MDPGEQIIALDYASRVLAQVPRRSRRAVAIAGWLEKFSDALGLAPRLSAARLAQDDMFPADPPTAAPDAAAWRAIEKRLERRLGPPAKRPTSALALRLAAIARAVGLDQVETDILGLAVRYKLHRAVERLWDVVSDASGGPMRITAEAPLHALLIGHPASVIERRLAPDGTLRASGLVSVDGDGELIALERLRRHLGDTMGIPPGQHDQAIGPTLLGAPLKSSLELDAFAHVGEAATHALDVLAGALRARRAGTHILLYGPPGTGKTEFCKTLAAQLSVPLYPVGEVAEDGREPGRTERLAELRLSQRLLSGGAPALLLFDEAEDLFDAGLAAALLGGSAGSKAHLLRLIETTPVPVLWTTNALEPLGAAMIRRMTFAIEMRVPDAPLRARLWTRELARHGVAMSEAEVGRLAHDIEVAPAIAAGAVAAAALTGGGAVAVRRGAVAVAKAMRGGRLPAPEAGEEHFDAALTNADHDLEDLATRLAAPDAPRAVSLLLSGPPGTGKSAYARALAVRLGMQPLVKRPSDLLSRFVGGSEQAIAAAFAEARDEGRFLILDEADAMLADRNGAQHGWEVTQITELLTWMDNHPLPFACTTNLPERLDPAASRRFLLKLRFAPLSAGQAETAFGRFFLLPAPAAIRALEGLVPADFALARRKAALLGVTGDAAGLLRLLAEEAASRPGQRGRIGFATC